MIYNYEDAKNWVMSQIHDPLKETYRIRLMNSFGGVKLEHPKYLAMITECRGSSDISYINMILNLAETIVDDAINHNEEEDEEDD